MDYNPAPGSEQKKKKCRTPPDATPVPPPGPPDRRLPADAPTATPIRRPPSRATDTPTPQPTYTDVTYAPTRTPTPADADADAYADATPTPGRGGADFDIGSPNNKLRRYSDSPVRATITIIARDAWAATGTDAVRWRRQPRGSLRETTITTIAGARPRPSSRPVWTIGVITTGVPGEPADPHQDDDTCPHTPRR